MMSENEQLARRAVACKAWRDRHPAPDGCGRDDAGVLWAPSDKAHWKSGGHGSPLPDFSDAATRGCLEELVCESLRVTYLTIGMHCSGGPGGTRGVGVWVERGSGALLDDGRTIREVSKGPDKAAALVAALEAAP